MSQYVFYPVAVSVAAPSQPTRDEEAPPAPPETETETAGEGEEAPSRRRRRRRRPSKPEGGLTLFVSLLTPGSIEPTHSSWYLDALAQSEADDAGSVEARRGGNLILRCLQEEALERARVDIIGARQMGEPLSGALALLLQAVTAAALGPNDTVSIYPDPSDRDAMARWSGVAAAWRWAAPRGAGLPRVEMVESHRAVHGLVGRAVAEHAAGQASRHARARRWSSAASRQFEQLGLGHRARVTSLPDLRAPEALVAFFRLQNREPEGVDWRVLAAESGPWLKGLIPHATADLDPIARLDVAAAAIEQLGRVGPGEPSSAPRARLEALRVVAPPLLGEPSDDEAPEVESLRIEVSRRVAESEARLSAALGRTFDAVAAWGQWQDTWPDGDPMAVPVTSPQQLVTRTEALALGARIAADVRAHDRALALSGALIGLYDQYASAFENDPARAAAHTLRARIQIAAGRPHEALADLRRASEIAEAPEHRVEPWTLALVATGRAPSAIAKPIDLGLVVIDEAIRGLGFGVSGIGEHPALLWGVMEWLAGLGCPDEIPAEVRAFAMHAGERLDTRAKAGERLPHPAGPTLRAYASIIESASAFEHAYNVARVGSRLAEGDPRARVGARTLAQWARVAPDAPLPVEVARARKAARAALDRLPEDSARAGLRTWLEALAALDPAESTTVDALLALGDV